MNAEACEIIDKFGGTSALSKLTGISTSTIHSWRKNGIPEGRMSHIRMVGEVEGVEIASA